MTKALGFLFFLFLFFIELSTCSQKPKLNTLHEEDFRDSIKDIERSLSGKKLSQFQADILYIRKSEKDIKKLNGLTSNELNEYVTMVSLSDSLKDMSLKKEKRDLINKSFENLKILKANIKNRKKGTFFIEFENNTSFKISGIEFVATIIDSQGKTLWMRRKIDHNMGKVLKPHEKESFEYTLPENSVEFKKGSIPKDYNLVLDINNVFDYESKPLYPAIESKEDKEQLQRSHELVKKLKMLGEKDDSILKKLRERQ